jgi:hypothetical protein
MHKSRSLFYLTTALHVSGVTVTHLQEHKTTVTIVSGNRYTVLLSAAIVEAKINSVTCASSWSYILEYYTGYLIKTPFLSRICGSGQRSQYGHSLWAGQSVDRISVEARFSAPALEPTVPPIQWIPDLFRKYRGQGVALTTHPI